MRTCQSLSCVVALCVSLMLAATCEAQPGRGFRGGRGPGGGGPGMGRGPMADDSFVSDRDTFHYLLDHHQEIRRSVTNLDNGVETLTESDNEEVAAKIQEHVHAMYGRVEEGRPIRMRDPLFAAIFRHATKVDMNVEETEKGVRVTETSSDQRVAQLIQAHAVVVSKFVERGFAEAQLNHEVPPATETVAAQQDRPLTGQQKEELLAASVQFDRYYIPVLALTNEGKAKPATKAIGRLSDEYDAIYQRVLDALHIVPDQSKDPTRQTIDEVAQLIADGQLKKAHETLEPIRDLTMQRRQQLGIDYPMDVLNEYHDVMESIVKPAVEMKPADVDEAYLEELKQAASGASEMWTEVEQTKFPAKLFGFDKEATQKLNASIAAERAAITALNRALADGDAKTVLKAAKGLKPPFAKVYKSFGDFSGLK